MSIANHKFGHITDAVNPTFIPLTTLVQRIQDEIIALTMLSAEVQIALGPALAATATLPTSVQRSLQAIDRLHQTLDDLQRVMGHISANGSNDEIDTSALSELINLRHLAHKLFDNVDTPFALSADESGEVAWF